MSNTLKFGNGQWATKKGSTLAYNDENGNFKPLPFDFTRASSATVINKAGLIETVGSGEPRIDYKDDSKGALLLENSATNLITYSEDFTQWSFKTGVGVSSNEITSVDGALNGSKIETTANGSRYVGNNYTLSTGNNTFSVFAKKGVNNWVYLNVIKDGTNNWNYTFDLENGLIGQSNSSAYSTTAKIEDYGNGWYRCSITANVTSAGVFTARIYCADSSTDVSTIVGSNVYIYAAQLEQGSYPTSYIPTQGQSGGVTRVADNAYQQSVTQVIGQSEGTMFIEFIPKDSSALQILYQAKSSSGVVGQIDIRLQSGLIRALANDGGGSQFFINGGSYAVGTKYKVAIRYKLNDSKLYINGTDSGSDTSCSFTGSSLDQVSFADSLSSFLPSVDIIDSRLYNTALTDSELAALTKI